MFRSNTVLVVGAGASCEAKFPDGKTLLQDIRKRLDIRFDHGNRPHSGDYVISNAILQLLPDARYGDAFNEYLYAAWRIRDASVLGLSIDNIIEQHDDDARVAVCGKLAILRSILEAEHTSLLKPLKDDPNAIDLKSISNTWYAGLGQLLTENVPRRKAAEVFENLSIICFNYDRAIEHFLPFALASSWGLKLDEVRDLTRGLKILHPYGSVSPLPWQSRVGGVQFGNSDRAKYADLVPQIRTFSERIEDEEALAEIRATFASATQIIFLGFAFHAPNMDLLRAAEPQAERVLATAYKLPENEKRQIDRQLRGMLNLAPDVDGLVLHDGTCADLLRENWRTISA